MKLDERFMTLVTMSLLVIGVGAVVQNGGIFGDGDSFEPQPDSFTLRAGSAQSLDVLLNDRNRGSIAPATLRILRPPACGTAEIVDGAIRFAGSDTCEGDFDFAYCVPVDGACTPAEVTLTLVRTGASSVARAGAGPAVLEIAGAGNRDEAPADPTQQAMKQPMRLMAPAGADVVTPDEATEQVRRIVSDIGPAISEGNRSDSVATISGGSARSGTVSVDGATMTAPDLAADGPGVNVAGANHAAPRRSGRAPVQPDLPRPASLSSTPSRTPENREVAIAEPGPKVDVPIVEIAALAIGGEGATPVSTARDPHPPTTPGALIATAAAPSAFVPAPPSAGREPLMANSGTTREPAPELVIAEPAMAPAPEASTDRLPTMSAARSDDRGPRVAPMVIRPAATTEKGRVPTGPDIRVATPTTPAAGAPELTQQLSDPAQLPSAVAERSRPSATPQRPTRTADTGKPPDPAISEPPPPPPDNSILASLARSNTVLGATVSAARALFGGSEPQAKPQPKPRTAAAPSPADSAPHIGVAPAALDNAATLIDGERVASLDPGDALPAPPAAQRLPQVAADTDTGPATAPQEVELASLPTDQIALALPRIAPEGTGISDICEVSLGLQLQVGAEIIASLSSPCRPEQRFLVDHAGLSFTAETDHDGVANFVIPAMRSDAVVRAQFADGGSAVARITVEGMARMSRIAVVWTEGASFDLHAREYGAAPGSDGDVWAENPRNYRLARRQGGGYLTRLGPAEGPAVRADVYTLFRTLRTDPGKIELRLEAGRADPTCDTGPVIRVLRSEGADLLRNDDLRVAECAGGLVAESVTGLSEISIAAQD